MSQTPRTDAELERMAKGGCPGIVTADFCRAIERENTTLRNYLMTLASDGAKPGDAKTIWRKVRGEMI